MLADPARFHGETLADPLEGRSYGRGKAKLYWNANNTVIINSFAHGGCVYAVHHDADYIEAKVEDAGEDAPFVLAALMAHARDFDAVTRERLRNLAAKVGGVGKRAVAQTIKEAAAEGQTISRRCRACPAATRRQARPRGDLILLGGERPAQLRAIEAKLRIPANVGPGSVIARGQATAVIRCAVDPVKLRAGKHEIKLPAGSAYLAVARPEHLQAQLDRLFAFAKADGNGEQYAVDCPPDLARYALANANLLPLQFISRTPVLRPDGSVLDRPGYDAATAIFYAPDETFPPIPDAPTQDDAAAALERLRHPFRGFPFVTDADRDAVVGEVLTLITRHLVPRAPAFVHNAVEAGSGKTKLFDTVAIIALGTNAALLNADILDDETELKKVLTTLTLAAAPLVVFDNVARGGQITSPGLSNYLTATIYGDRLLGSNTEVKAADLHGHRHDRQCGRDRGRQHPAHAPRRPGCRGRAPRDPGVRLRLRGRGAPGPRRAGRRGADHPSRPRPGGLACRAGPRRPRVLRGMGPPRRRGDRLRGRERHRHAARQDPGGRPRARRARRGPAHARRDRRDERR